MLISTKGRYALRVLVDLAETQGDGYVALKGVAARQEISEKYLESIIKGLVEAHILEGLRGKGGGYRLRLRPDSLTVGTVLRLTETSLAPVACLECHAQQCHRMSYCRTLPMWKKLDTMLNDFFDSITIADLMQKDNAAYDYII